MSDATILAMFLISLAALFTFRENRTFEQRIEGMRAYPIRSQNGGPPESQKTA